MALSSPGRAEQETTMINLKETLWKTLESLTDEQLKQFQWFLKQDDIAEGYSAIPEARLERADRQDTVDLMVQKYGCSDALWITKKILEKISRNDLVQRLSSTTSGLKELKNQDSFLLKCESEKKKAELGKTKAEIKLMIQERQTKIWEIKRSAELSRESAERHTADSVQVFGVLLQSLQKSLDNLIKAIEEKQKTTQKQAQRFIQELQQEISELTKRGAEVEQLSHTKDQSFSFQDAFPPTKNWTEVSIPVPPYGRSLGGIVNKLKEEFISETDKLIAKAKMIRVQEFAVDVTLDPDTASPHLILSDNGKQVYCGDVEQNLPDNPERFNSAPNVLGKQSFSSGRFYYEVQVKGKTSWDLGIVKESVSRKGSITASPQTGYWTICLRNTDKYKAFSVNVNVKYPLKKVGVFVDYDKGSVLFFNVDSADIIHSFTDCSFTEKIFPFFSPGHHHFGENSAPLIISPVNNTNQI
ncbi:E3 ubiquitin-protein ligase TRIM21-like [Trachinotus anak]|uniref:E3 ubiquitin-protein ligase TRIM21-like n=1 Tax=Trachinotus anak TaxID=443729 RepID=UPI0039F16DE1